MQTIINEELSNKPNWLKAKKLSLNKKITYYMVLISKRHIATDITLSIDQHMVSKCMNSNKN